MRTTRFIPRSLTVFVGLAVSASLAAPAFAAHDHFVVTPNGGCHQVASGQTAIDDPDHGGHHRFHDNVHLGATGTGDADANLGHGQAPVQIYKDGCPTTVN